MSRPLRPVAGFQDRAVRIPFSRLFRWGVTGWFTGDRQRPAPFRPERIHRAARKLDATSAPSLTWIGHGTTLLGMNGHWFLTDPNWHKAGVVPRIVRPGLHVSELPPLSAVVVTHNHYDHLSMKTLRRIARTRPDPLGICPLGVGRYLREAGFEEVVELDWWDTTEVADVTIHLVPARHWSRRGLFDTNRTLWGGFVFSGERKVYYAGDTAIFDGFEEIGRRLGPLDAALLPIGAYAPEWFMRHHHMTPEDAGEAFLRLGARLLVGIHWGTFILADEPTEEPPRRMKVWWNNALPEGRELWIPQIGESLSF